MTGTSPKTQPSVLIVGTGFGGLGMALELKRAGFDDFTILEKGDEIGGVWRENTYPGAGCDIPSPFYSYSFEPNPTWSARFSPQAEIKDYMNRVADKYGLRTHIRFGTEVTSAAFDADAARWRVETNTGDTFEPDVFVPATGQLSRPSTPQIPGRDSFRGTAFHSAEWDHDVDLTGKRVAVIGTGASAIQFVPRIQPEVAHLTLLQRSAPYISPKPDTAYRPIHHTLFTRLPALQKLERLLWWAFCEFNTLGILGNRPIAKFIETITLLHLRHKVRDKALRAKLTPDYPVGCKRVLFADNYYPALAEPNVHVETERITEITPAGVRTADGVEHHVDVIIYGTGFATQDFLAPMKIRGAHGQDLDKEWADGARAYLGMAVPGFPNMFIMYGPNTNLGSGSIIFMLEKQARYIRQIVEHLSANGRSAVDVRPEVEQRFDTEVQRLLAKSAWGSCASWYSNEKGRVTSNWPRTVSAYQRATRQWQATDYHIRPAQEAA